MASFSPLLMRSACCTGHCRKAKVTVASRVRVLAQFRGNGASQARQGFDRRGSVAWSGSPKTPDVLLIPLLLTWPVHPTSTWISCSRGPERERTRHCPTSPLAFEDLTPAERDRRSAFAFRALPALLLRPAHDAFTARGTVPFRMSARGRSGDVRLPQISVCYSSFPCMCARGCRLFLWLPPSLRLVPFRQSLVTAHRRLCAPLLRQQP